MENKKYIYLVERKSDKKLFTMHGNLNLAWMGVSPLFDFVADNYRYKVKTPFGNICNVSSDFKYNSKDYSVIKQKTI